MDQPHSLLNAVLKATSFQHADRLGSFLRQSNGSQQQVMAREYDAFGLALSSSGQPSRFGFAGGHGYQEDPESGLILVGHRYYDASTGRRSPRH